MAINVKFSKFDNTPWGFRLAGGSDFPQPLTVIKVIEGSLAECMGLRVGDVVVRLNDQPVGSLTHGQAHEALLLAGNNFVLGVQREEEALKALEALSEENIVPYKIPLADLPPVFPEQILREETVIEKRVVEKCVSVEKEEEKPEVEELPDKPKDADSEIIPNQNLTDDEIAQLILEEEELLNDQGVLGVNFKKPRPRIPVLRESKVLEELQHIAVEDPPRLQEIKHTSTFLQKPERPIPKQRGAADDESDVPPYRVVIKKQSKKTVTAKLLEKGLLAPGSLGTPEPPSEVKMHAPEEGHDDYPETVQPDDLPTNVRQSAFVFFQSAEVVDRNDFRIRNSREAGISNKASLLDDVVVVVSGPAAESCASIGSYLALERKKKKNDDDDDDGVDRSDWSIDDRRPSVRSKRLCARPHYFERCLLEQGARRESLDATRTDNTNWLTAWVWTVLEGTTMPRFFLKNPDTAADHEGIIVGRSKGRRNRPRYGERAIARCLQLLLVRPSSRKELDSTTRVSIRRQSLCPKAHYFQRVLHKSVVGWSFGQGAGEGDKDTPVTQTRKRRRLYAKGRYFRRGVNDVLLKTKEFLRGSENEEHRQFQLRQGDRRRSSFTRIKGHYLESYLARRDSRGEIAALLTSILESTKRLFDGVSSLDEISVEDSRTTKRKDVDEIVEPMTMDDMIYKIVEQQPCDIQERLDQPDASVAEASELDTLRSLSDSSDSSSLLSMPDDVIVQPSLDSVEEVAHRSENERESKEEEDQNCLSRFLRSTGEFVSTEVFHRRGRRASLIGKGRSRRNSVASREHGLNLGWFRFGIENGNVDCNDRKILNDLDHKDSRRLSFVPTVLYEGLTNRIGVDFTRLVAYAFVPCTSVVLLYMYK